MAKSKKAIKSNIRTMELIGIDDWNRPVYRCIENGALWKDINLGEGVPALYSCGNDYDGEPSCPIKPQLEIVYVNQYHEDKYTFSYQMLSRLQCDCEYYLGLGLKNASVLFYKNEQEHINEMKNIWKSFPKDKKPKWLTWEQILQYEALMVNK